MGLIQVKYFPFAPRAASWSSDKRKRSLVGKSCDNDDHVVAIRLADFKASHLPSEKVLEYISGNRSLHSSLIAAIESCL